MKVNLVEHIIPVVIELKNVLEKRHSPLLRYVMLYLKDLMSDYKEEVNGTFVCLVSVVQWHSNGGSLSVCVDILVADPQLAHEVEYDLRRFDEEQRQLQRQKAAAVRTPAQQSVRPAVDTPRTPGPVRRPWPVYPTSIPICIPSVCLCVGCRSAQPANTSPVCNSFVCVSTFVTDVVVCVALRGHRVRMPALHRSPHLACVAPSPRRPKVLFRVLFLFQFVKLLVW